MGTTLTGTTPQDTYDSLIKVTDNGPLSGTAKYLSDGLGNDSVLALSTSSIGIATTSLPTSFALGSSTTGLSFTSASSSLNSGKIAVLKQVEIGSGNGDLTIETYAGGAGGGERMRITSAGEVLINRSSASGLGKLNVVGGADFTGGNVLMCRDTGNVGIGTSTASRVLTLKNNAGATNGISFQSLATTAEIAAIECNQNLDTIDFGMVSNFAGNGFRFLTGSPTLVERARFTANGLTFNGDTAAANALDDYEEGTWTMGIAFGGASVGVTTTNNTGTYTKIGRQVTVNGVISLSNKGSSSGTATITGLPFTIGNSNPNFASASLWLINVSFANQFQAYGNKNTTTIVATEITEAGVVTDLSDADFANNSEVMVNFTYFV